MKWLTNGFKGPNKIFGYLLIPYLIAVTLIYYWPTVLHNWEGDVREYANALKMGATSIIFLMISIPFLFRDRSMFKNDRSAQIQLLLIFFVFFFMPISKLILLANTSKGFTNSPEVFGMEQIYNTINDIRLIFFVLAVALAFIWHLRTHKQDLKSVNDSDVVTNGS